MKAIAYRPTKFLSIPKTIMKIVAPIQDTIFAIQQDLLTFVFFHFSNKCFF